MTTATSTEHRTESSYAFLNRPPFLFRKVLIAKARRGQQFVWIMLSLDSKTYTERFRSSFIGLMSIFLRPMVMVVRQPERRRLGGRIGFRRCVMRYRADSKQASSNNKGATGPVFVRQRLKPGLTRRSGVRRQCGPRSVQLGTRTDRRWRLQVVGCCSVAGLVRQSGRLVWDTLSRNATSCSDVGMGRRGLSFEEWVPKTTASGRR